MISVHQADQEHMNMTIQAQQNVFEGEARGAAGRVGGGGRAAVEWSARGL